MKPQPGERIFEGQPAAPGFARGPAAWVDAPVGAAQAAVGAPGEEAAALEAALARALSELAALAGASDTLGAEILEFQQMLLEDDDILAPVRAAIASGESAGAAWAAKLDLEIADYAGAQDEYMAARAADLADLRDRVLRALAGGPGLGALPAGAILFARDLAPSVFLGLDWRALGGAVLSGGSATSHVAILARTRGVPMLVSAAPAPDVREGEEVALDAASGRAVASPSAQTLDALAARQAADAELAVRAAAVEMRPAITADGRPLRVLLNINEPSELDGLDPGICDGIGLTRTEFLFAHGAPEEDPQAEVYARILAWAEGRPVTIRTLDAGGDKPLPGITLDGEANPFLGTRGLRLSLRRPEIFRTQLRALARAAALGPLKVMLPMVTVPAELEAARGHLDAAIAGLTAEGVAHARPALGIMVEVPAAALTAGDFAADFYSIGSNDLVQYVTAAARDVPGLGALADPLNPAVLELIRRTIAAGAARGAEVSLCGEMASRPECADALAGLGLTAFSVAPASVGRVKLAISQVGARP